VRNNGGVGRLRCYVASPLGFNEAGRYYYDREYLPKLATVVEPVDPWALTSEAEVASAREEGRGREFALEIGRRNAEAIRGCSLLAAFLDGQEPDSGTVAEVGFAAALGLKCFGLRSDLRQTGEAGVSVNLQVESFIVHSGGFIAPTLDDLVSALAEATTRQSGHSATSAAALAT
jgi:nucleoside 2-deoxyribosyltransferase